MFRTEGLLVDLGRGWTYWTLIEPVTNDRGGNMQWTDTPWALWYNGERQQHFSAWLDYNTRTERPVQLTVFA